MLGSKSEASIGTLKFNQLEGLNWIHLVKKGLNSILVDEMGSSK